VAVYQHAAVVRHRFQVIKRALYEDGVLPSLSPLELPKRSRVVVAIYQVVPSADCPAHRDQINQALGIFFRRDRSPASRGNITPAAR
jgi:hypothetical protein